MSTPKNNSRLDCLLAGADNERDRALVIVSWLFWSALLSVAYFLWISFQNPVSLGTQPGVAEAVNRLREPAILAPGNVAVLVPDEQKVIIHESDTFMIIAVPTGPKGTGIAVSFDRSTKGFPLPRPWMAPARLASLRRSYNVNLAIFKEVLPTTEVHSVRFVEAGGMRGYEAVMSGDGVSKRYVELYHDDRRFRFEVACPGTTIPRGVLALFYAIVSSVDPRVGGV